MNVNATVETGGYGAVTLAPIASLLDIKEFLAKKVVKSKDPLTFGQLGQDSGLVLYETTIQDQFNDPAKLKVTHVKDRAYVFVNGELRGTLSRFHELEEVPISIFTGE